jgi:hypothetical protein
MNRAQFCQSIRPNRIISSLGPNMKKHAACEHRMEHSLHPRLCEHFFEVENALLTVSRAVGNGPGSPILLQLETT